VNGILYSIVHLSRDLQNIYIQPWSYYSTFSQLHNLLRDKVPIRSSCCCIPFLQALIFILTSRIRLNLLSSQLRLPIGDSDIPLVIKLVFPYIYVLVLIRYK
jgi:hypothetical protein